MEIDGVTTLDLVDKGGWSRAGLSIRGDDEPLLFLYDRDRQGHVLRGVSGHADRLNLFDYDRKVVTTLKVTVASGLAVSDREGKVIWAVP